MVSVMLYPCMCCVNGFVCFVCCVYDSVCELFVETIRIIFGCVFFFVIECYGLVKCCRRCSIGQTNSKEFVCCACDPRERLDAPSICFVFVCVCRKLSPHLGV